MTAPTEGRVIKPERQRGCRRGTPLNVEIRVTSKFQELGIPLSGFDHLLCVQ